MNTIVSIQNLSKTYDNGFNALSDVSLDIREGEILALLGPNGAGKTTLISIVCGIASATGGSVSVGGHDIEKEYRQSRSLIGLVPQELHTDSFESVWNTVNFSRGLFGKAPNPGYVEEIIRELTLWDKRDSQIMQLSGGMKRRVMIAKALSHEPRILFLDEPTAGVDVELRKDMWKVVERLRQQGVTIILTTHYIEEAEAIADRIAVINRGKLLLVEDKKNLMEELGKKALYIHLVKPVDAVPDSLSKYGLSLSNGSLVYTYDTAGSGTGITGLLNDLNKAGLKVRDLETRQSSLEDIFVGLVSRDAEKAENQTSDGAAS
ncbi:MAG: ABC transporter ATP-binding protein [Nitratireductor sp.]|nr:ABC transporter ATP-binding protein [Nitratireductor sp.]MCC0019503.1 ABC transporter ATP-binding protein [Nitratireductor sp.]